ncbi:MAG: DUF1801 domain-containing protein, partial [Bacteroidota bacterium]
MHLKADTPELFLDALPDERREAIAKLRTVLLQHLPRGFKEIMSNGMLAYVVPHSLFPAGYHVNPKVPLPFICIASQKNFVAFYHMGLYGSKSLLNWFQGEYPKHVKSKLDMGKSCVRFKKMNEIPYQLIAELAEKMGPEHWVAEYLV